MRGPFQVHKLFFCPHTHPLIPPPSRKPTTRHNPRGGGGGLDHGLAVTGQRPDLVDQTPLRTHQPPSADLQPLLSEQPTAASLQPTAVGSMLSTHHATHHSATSHARRRGRGEGEGGGYAAQRSAPQLRTRARPRGTPVVLAARELLVDPALLFDESEGVGQAAPGLGLVEHLHVLHVALVLLQQRVGVILVGPKLVLLLQ